MQDLNLRLSVSHNRRCKLREIIKKREAQNGPHLFFLIMSLIIHAIKIMHTITSANTTMKIEPPALTERTTIAARITNVSIKIVANIIITHPLPLNNVFYTRIISLFYQSMFPIVLFLLVCYLIVKTKRLCFHNLSAYVVLELQFKKLSNRAFSSFCGESSISFEVCRRNECGTIYSYT